MVGVSPVIIKINIAACMAAVMLRESAQLQKGETVLVGAAAGGIGSLAIQFAKIFGSGLVIGVASMESKRNFTLSVGADAVIDYSKDQWANRVLEITKGKGVDVLLEMNGGPYLEKGLKALAPFGRAIVYGQASGAWQTMSQNALDRLFINQALNQTITGFNIGGYFFE